jgi:hypothetical protein
MKVHANAALGPAGRLALIRAIESGMTPATAHRWWGNCREMKIAKLGERWPPKATPHELLASARASALRQR